MPRLAAIETDAFMSTDSYRIAEKVSSPKQQQTMLQVMFMYVVYNSCQWHFLNSSASSNVHLLPEPVFNKKKFELMEMGGNILVKECLRSVVKNAHKNVG